MDFATSFKMDNQFNALTLMEYYLQISRKVPDFRINDISYHEINRRYYGREHWPFTHKDFEKKVRKLKVR